MRNDPLVAALTAALEQTLLRGVTVTPVGEGWHVCLAPAQKAEPGIRITGSDALDSQVRRAW